MKLRSRRSLIVAVAIGVFLAAVVHVDWHLARPTHHRLSLGLPYHWLLTSVVFAFVGWVIARRWTDDRWFVGAVAVAVGLLGGQVIEPVLEAAQFQHRLGYANEPGRLTAFAQTVLVAVPAFAVTLWVCRPRTTPSLSGHPEPSRPA